MSEPTTELLRINEVAQRIKISIPHLRLQVRTGRFIAPVDLFGVKLWRASDVEKFISELGGAA